MPKHEPYARALIDQELKYSEWDIFNQIMVKNKPWLNNDTPIYFGLN